MNHGSTKPVARVQQHSSSHLGPCTTATPVGGNANRRTDPGAGAVQPMQRPQHQTCHRTVASQCAVSTVGGAAAKNASKP